MRPTTCLIPWWIQQARLCSCLLPAAVSHRCSRCHCSSLLGHLSLPPHRCLRRTPDRRDHLLTSLTLPPKCHYCQTCSMRRSSETALPSSPRTPSRCCQCHQRHFRQRYTPLSRHQRQPAHAHCRPYRPRCLHEVPHRLLSIRSYRPHKHAPSRQSHLCQPTSQRLRLIRSPRCHSPHSHRRLSHQSSRPT